MNDNHPETFSETLARIARLRRRAWQQLAVPDLSRETRWDIRRCIRLLDLAECKIRCGGSPVIPIAGCAPDRGASWWLTRESFSATFEIEPTAE